jgi:hypothetical protein
MANRTLAAMVAILGLSGGVIIRWTKLPDARNGSDGGALLEDAGADPIAKLFKSNGSAGSDCYITVSGKAYCWGSNESGQIGAAAAAAGIGTGYAKFARDALLGRQRLRPARHPARRRRLPVQRQGERGSADLVIPGPARKGSTLRGAPGRDSPGAFLFRATDRSARLRETHAAARRWAALSVGSDEGVRLALRSVRVISIATPVECAE